MVRDINWTPECSSAFSAAKEALATSSLLHHPSPRSETHLTVDASDVALGAKLEQKEGKHFVPLAFFSRKLSKAELNYSAYDRELLAIRASIHHFRHFLEGRPFTVWTDHRPLTFALEQKAERHSSRQARALSFISEFTSDIRHIKGEANCVADTLSRINALSALPKVNFTELAAAQSDSPELQAFISSQHSLDLTTVTMDTSEVICDVSEGRPRPLVPLPFRRTVFGAVHSLSHPIIIHIFHHLP